METNSAPILKSKSLNRQVYGSFYVGGVELVLPVTCIQEVVNYPERVIPVPLSPDSLVGVFNLRGLVIPVLSLTKLLGLQTEPEGSGRKIAIVNHEGARVGLVFDGTGEVLHVQPDQVVEFQPTQQDTHGVIRGAIRLDNGARILQILAPQALISLKNIPQIVEHQKNNASLMAKRAAAARRQCISFVAGQARCALEIATISEIIRVPELQSSVLGAAACIGTANLRGQTIPVIDFARYLGFADPTPAPTAGQEDPRRILIVWVGENCFGLMISAVESIVAFTQEEVHPIPIFGSARAEMFSGMLIKPGTDDIILLKADGLFSNDEIRELTKGHSRLYATTSVAKAQTATAKARQRQVFITFRLDELYAVSIKEISEIIHCPDEMMMPPGLPPSVRGVINLRQNAVTIVDLRPLFQLPTAPGDLKAKILIINRQGAFYGFVVDAVEDIATIDEVSKMTLPEVIARGQTSGRPGFVRDVVPVKDARGAVQNVMMVDFERVFQHFLGLAS